MQNSMTKKLLTATSVFLYFLSGHIANANPPGVSSPGFGKGPVYLGPQKILQSGRPTSPFQVKTIGVYVVQTADDDGSNGATTDANVMADQIEWANKVYAGTGVQFSFDAKTGIHPQIIKNTLANRDFTVPNGTDMNSPEDKPPKVESFKNGIARNLIAKKFLGKLVVFVSRGSELKYNKTLKKWEDIQRLWGWSNASDYFVAFPDLHWGKSNFFAHEAGHYLHLPHTFGYLPKNQGEFADLARMAVNQWGWARQDIPKLFDGDATFVGDTVPDPGPELFQAVASDACTLATNTIQVPVIFARGDISNFSFTPGRDNVMSYFKDCPGFQHKISGDQSQRVRDSIDYGNRKHLMAPYTDWSFPSPAGMSWGDNRLDVFTTANDASVHHKVLANNTWWPSANPDDGWEYQGGLIAGSVSGASSGENRLELVARDAKTNSVLFKSWDGSNWLPSVSDWTSLGGIITGEPIIFIRSDKTISIFARGTDDKLYYKERKSGQAWWPSLSGWISLGGQIASKPSITSWGPDRLDIVVRFKDGSTKLKTLSNTNWIPSTETWWDLGGQAQGDPAIVSWGPERLDIVVRGTDNAIWHKAWAGNSWYPSQTGWNSLGGVTTDSPKMITLGVNDLHIFVRGANAGIWSKAYSNTGWSPGGLNWAHLGGATMSSPQVIKVGGQRIDLLVRGIDSGIWRKSWNGQSWQPSANDWENLGRNF